MENRYVKIWKKIRIWSPIVDTWFLSIKWYQIQYDMDINRSTKMGKYQTWYAKLSIVSKCRDVMHSNNHVQIWFPSVNAKYTSVPRHKPYSWFARTYHANWWLVKSNFKLCARQRHMDGVTKLDWSKIGRNIQRTIKQLLIVFI